MEQQSFSDSDPHFLTLLYAIQHARNIAVESKSSEEEVCIVRLTYNRPIASTGRVLRFGFCSSASTTAMVQSGRK